MKQTKTKKVESKKAKVTRFFSMCLTLVMMCLTMMQGVVPAYAATPSIFYRSHCQNIGWAAYAYNGALSGSVGQSLRMEGLEIRISGMSGNVVYRCHVQNIGWQNWKQNGELTGTTGQSLQMEGLEIKLTGEIANHYDVVYRCHVQNIGWQNWKKNGELAGTTGQSLRIEAVEIKLVPKTGNQSGSTALSTALYKSSGVISCGFDGYKTTSGRHEGIDFVKGYGSAVYSLTDGVITRVTQGANGSNGLSTIAIYSESTGKTVVYLHTDPLDSLREGQTVSKGQQIATEAWRGCSKASDTHTHVEVRNGYRTAAAKSVKDYTLENENPTSFWNSQGYSVK